VGTGVGAAVGGHHDIGGTLQQLVIGSFAPRQVITVTAEYGVVVDTSQASFWHSLALLPENVVLCMVTCPARYEIAPPPRCSGSQPPLLFTKAQPSIVSTAFPFPGAVAPLQWTVLDAQL
jgi:hypothetical protein